MKRTPLSIGSTIQAKGGSSYTYIIDRVIGDGASSIVYEAHYIDSAYGRHDVRLKECYPYASDIQRIGTELVWVDTEAATNDKTAFTTAYHKLLDFQNTTKLRNSTTHIFDLCEVNGTLYSVMDVNEGQTFEQDNSGKLSDILKTTLALARVVEKYHNNGYLHLDIKPSNFLVIPETRELVILFDVDSVTSMEDIASGKVKCVSYSKGWAAPEQMQGHIDKLSPATDIFSIGAILFQKVMGRAVENEDIGIFADWDFKGELFDDVNPAIKRLLREIFKNTLAANIKRRYQNANELIEALDEARKVAEQEVYLVNEYVFSEITFVGREKDLANMHDSFSHGTKAIFLHGFGGVGKTALARRFAELYASEYDCIQFHRYTKDLSTIIDDYMINADSGDLNSHRKHLKKICENTKALIIVDNFDVEDDEDLEYMLSLNVDLIFTTRNDYGHIACDKIGIVELEALPTKELVSIFRNEYGKSINDEEEELVEEFIEKFGNLTILVPIIAKQIIASKISIVDFASAVEDDAFARFDDENEDIRIRKDGKSQRTNSLDFIRAMFNIAGLSDKHKLVLRYLDLLKYHRRLTIKEYRRLTGEKNLNVLNDLQFRNWISFVDAEESEEIEIKVHQLIYDLVEKDDKPTYQNVPGIVAYIDLCFDVLQKCISESTDTSKANIDFEKAQCFTYALLIYDDIKSSIPKEEQNRKLVQLYSFMCIAFLKDPERTYKLFFESPCESTYYFYVSGIMNWFKYAPDNSLVTYDFDWLHLGTQLDQPGLIFTFLSGSKIQFDSEEEKQEFKETFFELQSLRSTLTQQVSYSIMVYYFSMKQGESDDMDNELIDVILGIEDLSNRIDLLAESLVCGQAIPSDLNFLLYRIKWYLAVCKSPNANTLSVQNSQGIDIHSYYKFYLLVFELLQKALRQNFPVEDSHFIKRKAEEIIIMLEQQNEHFATYGLDLNDVLAYTPLSVEEHTEIQKIHWSKKAQRWYSSVIEAVNTASNPYTIYSLLLSSEYQKEFISNSKIQVLLKNNFIDAIYLDSRLSEVEKKEILIKNVIKEAHLRFSNITKLKKNSKRITQIQPAAELYYQALSKLDLFDSKWISKKLDLWNIYFVDVAIILRRLLGKEFFDINAYIESNISADNIDCIGDLLYLADKLRTSGQIKKSKALKNKILDLCLSVNFDELPEATIQMVLYKIHPLAVNYKRDDVVKAIEKIPLTIERKYSLALLDPQSYALALKFYEPENIATKFLDDYINAVAQEAYYEWHEGAITDNLDEMEQSLVKHREKLLFFACINHSYYDPVFGSNTAFGKTVKNGNIRSLCPFWVSQFHSSYNPEIDIGICYLIAETYSSIPYNNGRLACALEAVIDDDDSGNDYCLTREEIQTVLDNIISICPQAKEEIDDYLKKYPLK